MTTPPDRLSAALAGRYRIERELGAGGMATVYLAEDLKHDRKVAIKVLKPELAAVLGAERFVVEIKTTAAMSHPHILPLFDSGTADGFLFYVMPYIEGETIREKLNRETQFGVDEAVRIAREVADALDYAHRHGVIHRDIKPENILLHDGRAMVMDFGIALAVSAAAGGRMTETGLSLGTPHYMSPEQATAEKEITARADQYSLASVLYEMLTGNPPHTGASAQQIIMKIITEPAESVTKYRKAVPANVAATVAKALEKLPADRFESAKAFADALGNTGFTNATMAMGGARAAGASVFRSAPFLVAASVAAIATIAALWGWRRPAPPREVARFSFFFPDSQALTDNTASYRAALSPDGRTIVYSGQCACAGSVQLWTRPLEQLRAAPIPGTEGGMNPAFSPDGKNIAFTMTGGRRAIKRVSLGGGPALTLTDSLVDAGGVTWAADGYIYYDGHLEGDGVARVKETGGKPEIATRPDSAAGETYHYIPSALPEGRGVLFTITRGGNAAAADIAVVDSRTHKHKVLTRGVRAQYVAPGYLVYVTDGGSLMAAPFDLKTLALTGESVALAGGVSVRGNLRAELSVSGTGSIIYASGAAIASRRELVWVSRDGTATQVDRDWTGEVAGRPALSPDGRTVAVATGVAAGARQLWVKQLDRGPASKIAENVGTPAWSPDSKSIIYGSPMGIWRVPADGSALPTQVWKPTSAGAVSYTADGKWILFTNRGDIYGLQAAGDTAARVLVADPGTQANPTVSPDGKWLAYQSDESGTLQVYVRPYPDTKVAKRQISSGGGGAVPRWSRDGRELLYADVQTGDVTSVPVMPGTAFATGIPKRLFPFSPYLPAQSLPFDVSPDGKRFLFSRGVGSGTQRPDELVLVQNFVEELKAKVKSK